MIKQESFLYTHETMKELEFAESSVLKVLFQYRLKGKHENEEIANEVTKEYKSGMMDPSREVAKFEKLQSMKKNIGKKKIYNEYEKQVKQMKEYNRNS